jgi:CubicO group peptidase (beta-lactamase class C family)
MKVKTTVCLLVFGLLFNSASVLAQSGTTQFDAKTLKFDKVKFITKVNENRLGARPPLDGYAAVIIKDGVVVAEAAGGLAIRGNGGSQGTSMSVVTPADIGSAFKLVSFITLLSVFEKRAAVNRALTVEAQLNQPILPYMPKGWQDYVKASANNNADVARLAKITFAQLMRHKSGFRKAVVPVGKSAAPFHYISTGVKQENVGVRSYSNFNATVLTYLWPRLVDPASADKFDGQLAGKVANDDHPTYGKLYGDFFENWMQKNVFGVIQPGIRPSCDAGVDFPKRLPFIPFARFYQNPLGGDNPQFWSEKGKNYGCHAQGGYYVSMRELAAFMANYQATNVLISDKTREMMYDDSTAATRDDRLGWSTISASAFAKQHFGVNAIHWHWGDNLGHTAIVSLPGGFIAVGTITGTGSSSTVYESLKEAWGAAVQANF